MPATGPARPAEPMPLPLRSPPPAFRHLVAIAALFAQLFVATGAPVFARPGAGKAGAVPFPCQSHPCGCQTSEQGWAGDCCCFTLEQKLAWADARGIVPPEHVRPAVAARKQARENTESCCAKKVKRSCCESADEAPAAANCPPEQPRASELGVRWVAGVFAQKCRGEGPGGLLKLELISLAAPSPALRDSFDPVDSVCVPDPRPTSALHIPPTPPPRNS